MHTTYQHRQRKLVPRFRRKNDNKNLIDADDEEAQALIDKDLQSNFIWKSDTSENLTYQYDNYDNEKDNQQISIIDEINENYLYDIDNNNDNLWKINLEQNDLELIKWTHDQQQSQISFSIQTIQDKQQQWTLDDNNKKLIQFNLNNQDDHIYKHDLDTNYSTKQQTFIKGEQFQNNIKFGVECQNEEINSFPYDTEDIRSISIDSNNPSINTILSLPQTPINIHWIKGISQYHLSLPVEKYFHEYSPLNQTNIQLDSNTIKSLQWSIDILKENLILSYLINLPDNDYKQYSIPDVFNLKFPINDENFHEQLYSLIDLTFKQTISLSSNDINKQLLTIIDSFKIQQNFGNDEQKQFYQWSLKDFQIIIQNLSPIEILNYLYSPNDAKEILLENLLIESDEITARGFRRYRCKHISIKTDEDNKIDYQQGHSIQFKGNEQIAIGEEQIQNDLDQQETYRDITDCSLLLQDDLPQAYDIVASDSSPINIGPCLYRSDYECQPPKTWPRLRREIGYISYDASLSQPIYYLNKSFKRFVHIPMKRNSCSYRVYHGYEEFLEKVRLNPETYFRPYDATDLRPLLYWYTQKQNLFSLTDKTMLKPPKFICRRLVLRTILANLYCDSDPWKLLVVRIKGQFHLALANKTTKRTEDMTQDEYSGYNFEALFTTDQPNTTRFQPKIPLENPQQQFHTVQYWQFGKFNLLYSNEIDGELTEDMQQKLTANDIIQQQDETINVTTTTENSEIKTIEIDSWENEIPTQIDNLWTQTEDEIKQAQINENLELIMSDENQTNENQTNENQINEKPTDENPTNENQLNERKKRHHTGFKSGYVEMKCTNKKIFYRDESKLQTLHWWAQMWLANVNTLMIGYKTPNDGIIDHLDVFSIEQLISKFLSRYNLHLKYCLSYLYSFLNLIEKTVVIDDPNTIHAFAYIPQPLEIDPITGKPLQVDLPKCVPFRYTQMKRSNKRHENFLPQWYLQNIQRSKPNESDLESKTIEQEMKKRLSHRGRSSCILKQQQQQQQYQQDKRRRKKHK